MFHATFRVGPPQKGSGIISMRVVAATRSANAGHKQYIELR